MIKGRDFPERIKIMLPPPPSDGTQVEALSQRSSPETASRKEYVNLSQIQEAPTASLSKTHAKAVIIDDGRAKGLENVPSLPSPIQSSQLEPAPTSPPVEHAPADTPTEESQTFVQPPLMQVQEPKPAHVSNLDTVLAQDHAEPPPAETPIVVAVNTLPVTDAPSVIPAEQVSKTAHRPVIGEPHHVAATVESNPSTVQTTTPELAPQAQLESLTLQKPTTPLSDATHSPMEFPATLSVVPSEEAAIPEQTKGTVAETKISAEAASTLSKAASGDAPGSDAPAAANAFPVVPPTIEPFATHVSTAQDDLAEPNAPAQRRIAVTGNPNCGKSTLFNALTGLRQKVGNYPGVTVEKKEGSFFGSHGEPMQLLDLPGCYSLQARSPDEEVARDVLLGRQADTPRPDVVVAVVDATNLERNLYLLTQLLDLDLPVVLALNMVDLAETKNISIDPKALGEKLGIPVIPMVASKGVGLLALKQCLSQAILPKPQFRAPLPATLEAEAVDLSTRIAGKGAQFAEAVLLLGMPDSQLEHVPFLAPALLADIRASRARMEVAGLDPLSAAVDARYEWISTVIQSTVRHAGDPAATVSDALDAVLTHRIWGWLAFLAAMALMFFSIFTIAKLPADWISAGQAMLGDWLQSVMAEGDFRSLVIDGALAGVAGVLVFLPQILILTFFLGLLEDSGYMARAAFLMDRLMSRVGLHGKSFIPMLSSFACAIPGIMATRTIEQRKDRLVTILVSPLMSCSARLPVYTLLISVFLPDVSIWKKSAIMLSMYVTGIVAAFVMAGVFKKTLLRGDTPVLLMEMPPYRRPSLRGIFTRMFERASIFLKRAGTVILALSVLLWALTTYPKPANPEATGSERIAHSVAGRLGKTLEPVIAPLGFDWKIGIGLIGSFAAREVFVSTMGIVYSVENSGDETPVTALSEVMRSEKREDGSPVYTPLTATALMVFYVLAMQCISTLAVVRRETNSWKWPAFQFVYMTALAYAGAFLVIQIGHLFGWQ